MKTILIIEKHLSDREILYRFLKDEYRIMEADGYDTARSILDKWVGSIDGVIMNMSIPPDEGYTFLKYLQTTPELSNVPLIVSNGMDDAKCEREALRLGAWDYILKPYKKEILKFRLEHAMERSQLTAFQQLKFLAEYDALTKIYNKNKFLDMTEELLSEHPEEPYALVRFDINRFQLVNSFYGTKEGDRILQYIAAKLRSYAESQRQVVYGRVDADVFALCIPYDTIKSIEDLVQYVKSELRQAQKEFDLVPAFGIYLVKDHGEAPISMLNKAGLAAKQIKGSYVNNYSFYSQKLGDSLEREQRITNAMSDALEQGQFSIYLQPKYSLISNMPEGAEALVRWMHPEKGAISPGEFIPVFEKNGFITKMDYYVWEHVCILLDKWIREGKKPHPVSVNVSRVNIYNSDFVDRICGLTERYHIPNNLLQLELTESAYTDNLEMIKTTVRQLQEKGFVILMDDFGSAYSSLNVLKDINVDVLKIDMKFLENTALPERGRNILSSVVRMSKWLQIPVVAEGVETREQVEFLQEIGCEYIQGYYFARPMPVQEYEVLMEEQHRHKNEETKQVNGKQKCISPNIQGDMLFSNVKQALAIYAYDTNESIELLRVNQAFYELMGKADQGIHQRDPLFVIDDEYKQIVRDAFREATDKEDYAECEYARHMEDGRTLRILLQLQYMGGQDKNHILFGMLSDITVHKETDTELEQYREKELEANGTGTMLIVDANQGHCRFLEEVFSDRFQIHHAEDGKEALQFLGEEECNVDLILLELDLPDMDGISFLKEKQKNPNISMIPAIMVTDNRDQKWQIEALRLGASDYIIRPFIKEIVRRRVENVYGNNQHYQKMMQEYRSVVQKGREDFLTGVYNRRGIEKMVNRVLKHNKMQPHALLMVDIDNFKSINDTYGHRVGDAALEHVTKHLQQCFRKGDIIGRFGGDEFVVCMKSVPSKDAVKRKCLELCKAVEEEKEDFPVRITLSIGAAISGAEDDFRGLYEHADTALYEAKRRGKNRAVLFEELSAKNNTESEGYKNLDGNVKVEYSAQGRTR